ncbi:hypothetical protein AB0G67_45840 [Streptomyces sp. NPDC021056]|uniref:hypothetical protein n=1 Tax=Streptomyces sp. NPDC021056 TaxID=3155012 RepID=UPI0033D5A9BB
MKKIITCGLLAAVALSAATPAFADDDSNFGGGASAANNWNFSAAAVCLQEVAVVPVMGDWVGNHANDCSNGNVIDHARDTVDSLTRN